jgi:predicted  nucleic acid-binding Zn-ribbon protein
MSHLLSRFAPCRESGVQVESARHDLVLLVRLQSTYDQIAVAIRDRESPPPEVEQLEEENRRRKNELEALQAQVVEHSEEIREVRKKEEEWKLELEHFQRQKGMVTNEREFTAVMSEIDYATKALEEASARREELEGAIEQLTSDIESHSLALPEEEEAHKQVVESWEQRKAELRDLIHSLAISANETEAELHPKHRSRFLRLLESKKGSAVAAVQDGSCSVCHFSVRPHVQQRVRRCEELITCEHCHRILYSDETVQQNETTASTG